MQKQTFTDLYKMKDFSNMYSTILENTTENDDLHTKTLKPIIDQSLITVTKNNPSNMEPDELQQLADIVDQKTTNSNNIKTSNDFIAPNTIELINESLSVVLIKYDNVIVGGSVITDSTVENYMQLIPIDYYEIQSGKSLSGKLQLQFVSVIPEYLNTIIEVQLMADTFNVISDLFSVISIDDSVSEGILTRNKFKVISQFNTDWNDEQVKLLTTEQV